jgi:sugar-specific transcriptional regulator TrmB
LHNTRAESENAVSESDKRILALLEFGLTNVQARVYLALAQLKLASIAEISAFSKVRREEVYRSLPRLESLGLVEKTLDSPIKIKATPVDQALSTLLRQEQEQITEKMKSLEAKRRELIQHFEVAPNTPNNHEEKAGFGLLSKRESILSKVASIIKNVELELNVVYGSNKLIQFFYTCSEELKQAARRGVKLRMITDLQAKSKYTQEIIEEQLSPRASFDISYAELPLSHFLVSDFKEALLSTSTEGNLAERSCLWTNNVSLIHALRGNFESLWQTAMRPEDPAEKSIHSKVLESMRKLRPTNHAMLIYDSLEAKHQILSSYLNAGLTNNEAGIYVVSEETSMAIRAAMKKYGIDAEKHEKIGALQILNSDYVYMRDGKFDTEKAINFWKEQYYQALEKKFGGLRVMGETAFFFNNRLVPDLVNYEKNLQAHGPVLFTALDQKLGMIEIRT